MLAPKSPPFSKWLIYQSSFLSNLISVWSVGLLLPHGLILALTLELGGPKGKEWMFLAIDSVPIPVKKALVQMSQRAIVYGRKAASTGWPPVTYVFQRPVA